ncbi:hypothetical protein JVT61DRAFT_8279 [Boletus reticuloceps]|uniref:Uncharacterized protein n=1 Tax=Boletus reticuloceps TaxID=495285 RepID=A0A8I2YYB3_9AGAM|nr:hypothetical protein JVT61DRAFT_8279 [Boletus reticuloceps]
MRLAVTCYLVPCIYGYAISQRRLPSDSAGLDRSPPATGYNSPQSQDLRERIQLRLSPSLELDPYPDKPRITFKEDGSFKLTIFSDIHFGENPWDSWGPKQDINTTALMEALLQLEKPDYV